jgi:hypothetical protein
MGSQRRTLESDASSTQSLGTILMNVTPKNNCWLRQKPQSQMFTETPIHNQKKKMDNECRTHCHHCYQQILTKGTRGA